MANIEDYQILHVIEDIEDAEERQRRYYNPEDPYALSDFNFMKLFRLRKEDMANLENLLGPLMPQRQRISGLDIRRKIMCAVRFLAAGSYQLDVGKNFAIGVSQPSVSRSLNEVVNALNSPAILDTFIQFPNTAQKLTDARQRFYNQYGFPGVVGCVDGTHVAIVAPLENEHLFVNRKRYHSLNVQIICDETMKIINVNARYPGNTHDSYIWQNSSVEHFLSNLPAQHRGAFYVLGDSGYPLRPWILTPILPEPAPNTPEAAYNVHQRQVRSIVECCIGRLKSRFRCLLRHRTLHYCPETAGKIVNACAVLHNICEENDVPIYNDDNADNEAEQDDIEFEENGHEVNARQNLAEGRRIQNQIVQNYLY